MSVNRGTYQGSPDARARSALLLWVAGFGIAVVPACKCGDDRRAPTSHASASASAALPVAPEAAAANGSTDGGASRLTTPPGPATGPTPSEQPWISPAHSLPALPHTARIPSLVYDLLKSSILLLRGKESLRDGAAALTADGIRALDARVRRISIKGSRFIPLTAKWDLRELVGAITDLARTRTLLALAKRELDPSDLVSQRLLEKMIAVAIDYEIDPATLKRDKQDDLVVPLSAMVSIPKTVLFASNGLSVERLPAARPGARLLLEYFVIWSDLMNYEERVTRPILGQSALLITSHDILSTPTEKESFGRLHGLVLSYSRDATEWRRKMQGRTDWERSFAKAPVFAEFVHLLDTITDDDLRLAGAEPELVRTLHALRGLL